MVIQYCCVTYSNVILVEKTIGPSNYRLNAQDFMNDLSLNPVTNSKTSSDFDGDSYHSLANDGFLYICATDKSAGRRVPYMFLEAVKGKFTAIPSLVQRAGSATAMEFNRDFQQQLLKLMNDFNSGKGDNLSTLQSQVSEVTDVMKQNIDKVLDRGDKLDDLVDKSDYLQSGASNFKRTATKVNRKMMWRNKKMMIIIAIVVIIILTLIILAATGVI